MLTAREKDAVKAAQILMAGLLDRRLVPDGWWGSYTQSAFVALSQQERNAVEAVLASFGTSASKLRVAFSAEKVVNPAAKEEFRADRAKMITDGVSPAAAFRDRVIPAVKQEAARRGVNPVFYVAQLALESSSGARVPRGAGGAPSYNYGGMKTPVLKSWTGKYGSARAATTEHLEGKAVSIIDGFATFETPEDFVQAYFWYLHDGPSAYRYKGIRTANSIAEFAALLKRGGYATDGDYVAKLARMEGAAKSLLA